MKSSILTRPRQGVDSERTPIPFEHLIAQGVARSLCNQLKSMSALAINENRYIGDGYKEFLNSLPPKIARSRDLAAILNDITKINRLYRQSNSRPVFSDDFDDFTPTRISFKDTIKPQIESIEFISNILSSNRSLYLKLALCGVLRYVIPYYEPLYSLMDSTYRCLYFFEVTKSDKTFEDILSEENKLEMLEKDSYMNSLITKFVTLKPLIEKDYPVIYKTVIEAVDEMLKADSINELVIGYRKAIEAFVDVPVHKTNETYAFKYNLDCGCEHPALQTKDIFIAAAIEMLYKLKA